MKGRNALVTGGGRGIGRAIALELARRGMNVAVNYRKREAEALETTALIEKEGVKAVAVRADVSRPQEVVQMAAAVRDGLGEVAVLVNNAGLGLAAPLMSTDDELWNRLIGADLSGVFHVSREFAPAMIDRRWGRIINMSSITGLRAPFGLGAYAAAKAGVLALTQSLAIELAPHRITVNAVCPGVVDTRMGMSLIELLRLTSPAYKGLELEEAKERWAKRNTLLGRIVKPEEVASLVGFLASDESSAITGQAFVIDAGQLLSGGRSLEE
jgi:3-oxoacyl-[acyl-carrier protein] reductase